jgi:LCP family protein required for cell wall assembly
VRDGSPRRGIPVKKRHRGLKITLIAVLAVVLAMGGGLAYAWYDLNSKIHQVPVDPYLPTISRPPTSTPTATVKYPGDPFAGRAMNILVMGTDSREGANAGISADDPGGARADTTFIAHVSADRTRVDIVSIPRDLLIVIPQCLGPNGKVIPEAGWGNQEFNAAYAWAYQEGDTSTGAACAIRATEALTNVRIDAYVVIDFMGFVNVVDAIGGIDVTLLCPMKAKQAGVNLPAGVSHLDGMTAVGLARARTGSAGVGDGSDLSRIRRQHALFNAIFDKVFAMNYVTDFPKLYSLVRSVLESIQTDIGDLAGIAGLAYSLKNFDTSQINFVTVPVHTAASNPNRVDLSKQQAKPYFDALQNDTPLPSSTTAAPAQTAVAPPGGETTAPPVDPAATTAPETTAPVELPPAAIQTAYDCQF